MSSIGEKWRGSSHIDSVVREQKYDKNNPDHLAKAIHLKPQNLSYLKSWMVTVIVFVYPVDVTVFKSRG